MTETLDLETLETRADELRELRAQVETDADDLSQKVATGHFGLAGEAADKRAELDALTRALESVERDADALRAQQSIEAEAAARRVQLDAVRQTATDAIALDIEAQREAAELAAHIEVAARSIWQKRAGADEKRSELLDVANNDFATFEDALPRELRARVGYKGHKEGLRVIEPPGLFAGADAPPTGARAVVAAFASLAEEATRVTEVRLLEKDRARRVARPTWG